MGKKQLLRLLSCAAVCLASLGSVRADDGSIGVYLDAAGTQCDGQTAGGILVGSVWVNLSGATAGGVTSAEFRIDNTYRDDYLIVPSANPAATVVLGSPFDMVGVNIGFPACQSAVGRVQLYSFQVFEMTATPPENDWLTVRQRFTPQNPLFDCPLVTLCDAPVYTKICVGARDESDHWRAVINPSAGVSGDCSPVAVTQDSWSRVKGLYRN